MDVYEREVKKLLEEGGVERLKSQFKNLSRRLDDVSVENRALKKHITDYEKEVEERIGGWGKYGLSFKRICEMEDTINEQKKQISELESELAVKEDLIKIAMEIKRTPEENIKFVNLFGDCEEESLPFSSDECEDCLEEELEDLRDRHQQDCITINQLHTTIDTLVDRYAKLREMRGL